MHLHSSNIVVLTNDDGKLKKTIAAKQRASIVCNAVLRLVHCMAQVKKLHYDGNEFDGVKLEIVVDVPQTKEDVVDLCRMVDEYIKMWEEFQVGCYDRLDRLISSEGWYLVEQLWTVIAAQ